MLNWKRIRVHALTLVAGCLLAWSAAQAQRPPEQPPKASNAPTDDGYSVPEGPKLQDKTGQRQPIATLKVNVQVVTVFFNVKDKRGGLIPNLKKEDFQVAEDGKPQTIKYFAAESNQPLTLGLLIDTSGSQRRVLPMEQEVGSAFLRDVLTAKDLAFLINFDIQVSLLHDYTSEPERLRRAMLETRINDGGGSGAVGIAGAGQGTIPVSRPKGTLLYDAVYLAANEKLRQQSGRKALVLLTDGADYGSDETLSNAMEAAQQAISSPLLDNVSVSGAMGVLVNITGGAAQTRRPDRRARHRRRQRREETAPRLRRDRHRAAQPVHDRLHSDERRPGW